MLTFWFGLFAIANVIGALRNPHFDENIWWMDLRFLPGRSEQTVMVIAGLLLVAHALRPAEKGWRRLATTLGFATIVLAGFLNTVDYYRAWARGDIHPLMWVPLSLLLAILLVLIWRTSVSATAPAPRTRSGRLAAIAIATALFFLGVPLLQFVFFGTTDYRRPADAIVVLGAKVNPGGVPSKSLNDRMATAIELYKLGMVDTIIVSGGVEPSGYDEASDMRDVAVAQDVPSDVIILDPGGVNTDATVKDTVAIFRKEGFQRILVVSHFYHLPRIKLAYAGAGWDVYTVPSRSSFIKQLPLIVAREIPAFWVYYLRAALST